MTVAYRRQIVVLVGLSLCPLNNQLEVIYTTFVH
jgi:hypothetical protein